MNNFRLFFLSGCFIIFTTSVAAQTGVLFGYLDSSLLKTNKDSARFITEFVAENNIYKYTRYLAHSGKIVQKSFFLDSAMIRPAGLSLYYYESGQLRDSVEFDKKSKKINAFHYYENGQLICHFNHKMKDGQIQGFDESGKEIKAFIYEKEAEFPGGNQAWMDYLNFKIKHKKFAKNGAPLGKHRVVVFFVIDKNGDITNIRSVTSNGYGMEEEVIRVIKGAPKWEPAIQFNKPVKAYRSQPITFIIELE